MLVEHEFVTTMRSGDAMRHAARFLQEAGFRIRECTETRVDAVRGRKNATSRKIRELPQFVTLDFDRGRVTVGAGIEAKGNKEKPAHQGLMTAVAVAVERLLVRDEPIDAMVQEFRDADKRAGTAWTAVDVLGAALLTVLLLVLAVGVLALVISAIIGH